MGELAEWFCVLTEHDETTKIDRTLADTTTLRLLCLFAVQHSA